MKSDKIITFIRDQPGGIRSFWKSVSKDTGLVDVILIRDAEHTSFDAQMNTIYFSRHDKLTHAYKMLAELIPIDSYAACVINEYFEAELIARHPPNIPVCAIIHGAHEHYYSFARKYTPYIDHYFCVSGQAEFFLNRIIPARKSSTFQYSISLPSIKAIKENKVIFVGRFEQDKNLIETIELFQFLKKQGMQIRFAGDGSMLGKIRQEFSDEEIIDGNNRKLVLSELASSRFLCLLSYVEGLPVVFREAMFYRAGVILNYIDSTSGAILSDNYIINTEPDLLILKMKSFSFPTEYEAPGVNAAHLNHDFISQIKSTTAGSRPKAQALSGTFIDNFCGLPNQVTRLWRASRE